MIAIFLAALASGSPAKLAEDSLQRRQGGECVHLHDGVQGGSGPNNCWKVGDHRHYSIVESLSANVTIRQ